MKHLVVVEGPTASGKTALSISIAKHFNTCILSADSRQFYKELSIGTAKPNEIEMDGIKHYFIDSHSIHDEVSASRFEKEAMQVLNTEFKKHDCIVLVGGSGMFIDALCNGMDEIPTSENLKHSIQEEYEKVGLEPLLVELHEADPEYYKLVDKNNPMRILRAIEVIRLTGKPYSEFRTANIVKRPFEVHRFVIDHERDVLYSRINQRVDLMIENGLLNEAKSVYPFRKLTSLNTVGYKEFFNYIDGEITFEDAIEKIKQNTRRYAKRQLTWFRKHNDAIWIKYATNENMLNDIIHHLKKKFSTI